ncbi:MAG: SulP family inorganic anion transporter [Acidimicrobiia bacterium]
MARPRGSVLDALPLTRTIRSYRPGWLRADLVAGTVLAAMLIPQGMAYAELTGLPAITGIYTTIAALVAYALVGPNRRLVLGPDSSLAPVIAAVILPLAAGNADQAVALAASLSILAGAVCLAAGWLRLGAITELLSKPVRVGYLNGIAVLVFVSQLPKALGFSVDADDTLGTLQATARAALDGAVAPTALALSAGSVVVIVVARRLTPLLPGVVVAAVGSLVVGAIVDLEALGVSVVGDLPRGLPAITLPSLDLATLGALAGGAVLVALVSFADTGALSTATALRSGERVDPNAEIKALGAANLLSGVVSGFPTSASSSRTAVALTVGARTQLAGLFAAVGVVALLGALPGVVAALPSPTLAAIVITASFALFDWPQTRWLARVRRSEFVMLASAFAGVLLIGVLEGIGIAIALSIGNFVRKEWRPHSTELGRVVGTPGYHDVRRHPEAELVDELLMVRFDAPLFFANAADFGRTLQTYLADADRPIRRVLVVANAITDVDTTGAEVLEHLLDDLGDRGITLSFAGMKGPVKDRLRDYALYQRIGDEGFFPNTISAVQAHESGR